MSQTEETLVFRELGNIRTELTTPARGTPSGAIQEPSRIAERNRVTGQFQWTPNVGKSTWTPNRSMSQPGFSYGREYYRPESHTMNGMSPMPGISPMPSESPMPRKSHMQGLPNMPYHFYPDSNFSVFDPEDDLFSSACDLPPLDQDDQENEPPRLPVPATAIPSLKRSSKQSSKLKATEIEEDAPTSKVVSAH